MQIINKIEDIRKIVSEARAKGAKVGLVPTMGYFHEGHLTLMRKAREENDFVVVSLFVNPIQFGPTEDLKSYPKDLERDASLAEEAGVDIIFNPTVEEMYPAGYNTYVDVHGLTEGLCGATREGHFRGVTTVVSKLFNIVRPDRAYFGCKDYQQLKVIERMVADLNVPLQIVPVPIVREADGLAMSSRNTYLSPEERQAALVLSKSLKYAQQQLDEGITSAPQIVQMVEAFINKTPLARIDYVSVVNTETLEPLVTVENGAVIVLAVRIGKTRLIDNALIKR